MQGRLSHRATLRLKAQRAGNSVSERTKKKQTNKKSQEQAGRRDSASGSTILGKKRSSHSDAELNKVGVRRHLPDRGRSVFPSESLGYARACSIEEEEEGDQYTQARGQQVENNDFNTIAAESDGIENNGPRKERRRKRVYTVSSLFSRTSGFCLAMSSMKE